MENRDKRDAVLATARAALEAALTTDQQEGE